MIDEHVAVDRIRMIEIRLVTFVERHVGEVSVVRILLDKHDIRLTASTIALAIVVLPEPVPPHIPMIILSLNREAWSRIYAMNADKPKASLIRVIRGNPRLDLLGHVSLPVPELPAATIP